MNTQEYLELCYLAGMSEEAIDQLLASWVESRSSAVPPQSDQTRSEATLGPSQPESKALSDPGLTPIQTAPQPLDPVLATAIEEYDFSSRSTYNWPEACVYCGDVYTDQDHLLPRTWTGKGQRYITPTVPACGQCNRILSDHFIPRIHERAAHILHKLRTKYRRELSIKKWEAEELKDMSYKLRLKVEAAEEIRNALRSRVEVLECGGLPYYSGTPLAHQ